MPTKRCAFKDVTRENASLYVAEFDDGTIKVGQSNNPRSRLDSLRYQAAKLFSVSMVRWHVFAGAGVCAGLGDTDRCRFRAQRIARRMEGLCLTQLAQIATVRGPGREFFTGLQFDAAVAHVASVIEQVAESVESDGVDVFHASHLQKISRSKVRNSPQQS